MTTERKFVATAAIAVAFASGALLSRAIDGRMTLTADPPEQTAGAPAQSRTMSSAGVLPDLSGIAERGIQASVNISSTEQVQVDPVHSALLRRGPDRTAHQPRVRRHRLGGWVHPDQQSRGGESALAKFMSRTNDNREVPASVIGVDTISDLAVIKADSRTPRRCRGVIPIG